MPCPMFVIEICTRFLGRFQSLTFSDLKRLWSLKLGVQNKRLDNFPVVCHDFTSLGLLHTWFEKNIFILVGSKISQLMAASYDAG